MTAYDYKPWTSRCVYFTPHPRTPDEKWEAFFDDLPEVFWREPVHTILRTLSLSSSSRVICVGGWPRWVPQFVARNIVAHLAHKHDVGGDAVFIIERNVLANREVPDDEEDE